MGLLFGTDGIRGIASPDTSRKVAVEKCAEERTLTAGLLQLVGEALGTWLRPEDETVAKVVIGWDERPLNPLLVESLTLGLHLSGCQVVWAGVCATPGLHGCLLTLGADAGCMVTASHNPVSDSGIKIFTEDGYKTLPDQEAELESLILQLAEEERVVEEDELEVLENPDDFVDGITIHREILECRTHLMKSRYLDGLVSESVPSSGLILDSSRGSASDWLGGWLSEHLVKTTEVSNGCTALNDGCGAGELSPTMTMSWAELADAEGHVLFDSLQKGDYSRESPGTILAAALDGDGDRCLLLRVDAEGGGIEVVDGDRMLDNLAMAACHISPGLHGAVAASIESDLSLLDSMSRLDGEIETFETAVGDRWLAVALRPGPEAAGTLLHGKEEPFRIGGEDSGHLLLTTPHPLLKDHWAFVGDGIATLIASLCALTTCRNQKGFNKGWKSRVSISPSDRARWDGRNENSMAVIDLLGEGWIREMVEGEENLLMMKKNAKNGLLAMAVRNSGTQAKTSISARSTGEPIDSILQEVKDLLKPRLTP